MTQLDELKKSNNDILERLDKVEKEKDELKSNHSVIQEQVKTLRTDMGQHLDQLDGKIDEEINRLRRINNIIVMGLPEGEDGVRLAEELMQIILPNSTIEIKDERLGRDLNAEKPRPMRIRLSNEVEKQTALNNCKKLKGLHNFNKVSVKKDLTKMQQVLQKRTPVQTRARVAKRKNQQMEGENPTTIPTKIIKSTANTTMDMD